MPTTRTQRQVYADLTERYGRLIADAFFAALDDLRSQAEVQRIMARYQAGDIEGALEALHIDPEALSEVAERIRQAYAEGGKAATDTMPRRKPDGTALVVRFDGRNPEAEVQISRHAARLVTGLVGEQRQMLRERLSDAMRQGVSPRKAALDIVGRVNRVTGKREGGVLGLTKPQEGFVRAARAELASDDPKALRSYLERQKRDRRFDRSVQKAIREGKPLPIEIQQKAATAYERRLLQLRGETIGRVEAMASLQGAKREAFRQAIASGKVAEADVRKVWRSAGDFRVRHTHRALNGDIVGFSQPFVSPSGARMQHPMDTSLGAGADEIVNCRCDCEYRIDFLSNVR